MGVFDNTTLGFEDRISMLSLDGCVDFEAATNLMWCCMLVGTMNNEEVQYQRIADTIQSLMTFM